MTKNEGNVFKSMYISFDSFGEPPKPSAPESDAYWAKAIKTLTGYVEKHGRHPLACEVGMAVFSYLETIAKIKEVSSE